MIKEVFKHAFALQHSQPQRGKIVLQSQSKGPCSPGKKTASSNLFDESQYLRKQKDTGQDSMERMLQKGGAEELYPMEEEDARTSPAVLLFHCPQVSGSVGELLAGPSVRLTSKMGVAAGEQRQPQLLSDALALLQKQAGPFVFPPLRLWHHKLVLMGPVFRKLRGLVMPFQIT